MHSLWKQVPACGVLTCGASQLHCSASTHCCCPSTRMTELWVCLQNLDFDFEKCCSVTLSKNNVYACLVCGKYFQVSKQSQTSAFVDMDEFALIDCKCQGGSYL